MAEEWDVFSLSPGGDYAQPEYLATLYTASQKSIRVELNGTGQGAFSINRRAPECTEAVLAQGNLVKVRIPEIDDDYIFAFFIETGDFTLISSQERGGEDLHFGGRGILSYLEYARAAHASFIAGGQDPEAGLWRAYAAGTGSAPGQILRRMLEEMQHADRVLPNGTPTQPLPLLTIDFDYTNDSTTDPWDETDATDEFTYQVGEDGLAILLRLLETETIRVQMSPGFLLSAYNVDTFGRDLTGDAFGAEVVRFERGVNIAVELRREMAQGTAIPDTHIFVQGEADQYGGAVLSDAADRVTKEAFLPAFGTTDTALNAIGLVDLNARLERDINIQFQINNRRTSDVVLVDPVSIGSPLGLVATDGYYLPGPEGTLGDFWVGDTVRVHTGSNAFDYNETDALVEAITIAREDEAAELTVIVELGNPVQVPGTPSFFTSTNFSGCEVGTWPLGSPPPDYLLVGFLAERDNPTLDSTKVPIGNGVSPGSETCNDTLDIAGTEWTFISQAIGGGASSTQVTLAYRDSEVNEPEVIRWGGASGLPGTSRPRSHQVAIEGLSGAPTVTVSSAGATAMGAVMTSSPIVVTGPGYIFAGFSYRCTGPADGSSPDITLTARAPAVDMTRGWAYAGFGPYSWFGYIHVTAAMFAVTDTYDITVDRTNTPRTQLGRWWLMGFWPE